MADWKTTLAGDPVAQPARKHIVIVNGVPAFVNVVRELFPDGRYTVTTTTFRPRTVRPLTFNQLTARYPDLLLVDVVVGERAGWDPLDHLLQRAASRGIPAIVYARNPALVGRARALATPDGLRRFLVNPFDLAALLRLVDELTGPA